MFRVYFTKLAVI